jgi:UDP-glucose 4-epimerase
VHTLITGGLGFIGSRVGGRLAARGHKVSIVDLPRLGAVSSSGHQPDGVSVHLLDIVEVDRWADLLDDVDVVLHGAGVHQVDEVIREPERHIEVNVRGTQAMLHAATTHGVSRFVNLSSAKLYGDAESGASKESDPIDPMDTYALGKSLGEKYCRHIAAHTAMEVTSIRPFSVYGPEQNFNTGYIGALLESLLSSRRVVLSGEPDYVRDFVHVDTVADVIVSAVCSSGPPPLVLNAASGRPTTLAELVELFEEISGRSLEVTYAVPRAGTLAYSLGDASLMNDFACPHLPDLSSGIQDTIHTRVGLP